MDVTVDSITTPLWLYKRTPFTVFTSLLTKLIMSDQLCHCPHCTHCKELREEESKKRLEEERRQREREELQRRHEEYLKNQEQGKIYGDEYYRYRPEDVKNIIDVDFLLSLSDNFWRRAQPVDDYEWLFYNSMNAAIYDRLHELLD